MNFSWLITFSNVIGLRNLVKCADFLCNLWSYGCNKHWICEGGGERRESVRRNLWIAACCLAGREKQIWLLIKIKWSAGKILIALGIFLLSGALAMWLVMWHLKQFGFNARWPLAVGLCIIKDCFSKI